MKYQNRQFTKLISLLKFPGLQYLDDGDFRYLGRPTNVHGSELRSRAAIEKKSAHMVGLRGQPLSPRHCQAMALPTPDCCQTFMAFYIT